MPKRLKFVIRSTTFTASLLERRFRLFLSTVIQSLALCAVVFTFSFASTEALAQVTEPKTKFKRVERGFTIDPSQNMDVPTNLDCTNPTGQRLNGHTIPTGGSAAAPNCAPLYDVLTGMTSGNSRRCPSDHTVKGFSISGNRLDLVCN